MAKRIIAFLYVFCIGFVTSMHEDCDETCYMTKDMTPTPGPEKDTVYQPGTPGGQWTPEEVDTTKRRILQMIHPDWKVKVAMGTAETHLGRMRNDYPGECTENVLMRLVFHDCIPYIDGTGGCDGCMNWNGMTSETPNPNDKANDMYRFDPVNATDNKGLDGVAQKLELIYTTIDWPFQAPSLEVSLHQSGKSRADLWQLAGLVALEEALERANRACDLDFHARQQVTILEGRDKCEIKLTKPLKFMTGRKDCISNDPEGRGYVTDKKENQPKLMGDGNHVVDYGRIFFGMDSEHFMALQAIHGAVHAAHIGLKYTWFGPGYISNVYFKMIANHPRYMFDRGGDLSFTSCNNKATDTGNSIPIYPVAFGDKNGKPVAQTGWRASCMYLWNTTEGGPCVLRPTPVGSFDAPNKKDVLWSNCVTGVDSNGQCKIRADNNLWKRWCGKAWCDENNIVHDGKTAILKKEPIGTWTEDLSYSERQSRHYQGWNNQFAFPYEIGMYWNLTVGGVGQRAIGCPGLDQPFGTVDEPNWPLREIQSPIWASKAMDCGLNMHAPEGRPLHEIVDELASDNEHFAEKFLEGWQQMTNNGYSADDLVDGPQNGWIGYSSLAKQGVEISDFESYIADNAPVIFTDPQVDPWICGHRGHATTSCGFRFSEYFSLAASGESKTGCAFWTPPVWN